MRTPMMETLAEAIDRLRAAGYRADFRAAADRLETAETGRSYAPESLAVDEVVRFEGPSDPADESILFALRGADGVKGTWVVAYGPAMDAPDAELVRRLRRKR